MDDILVYTFRTFPEIENLKRLFGKISVLGKIKEDIRDFCDLILKTRPKFVLGIAKSINGRSCFEPYAVNRFNKSKKIAEGAEQLSLFVPDLRETEFCVSKNLSTSFCNYSMYKIQDFMNSNNLKTHFSFAHINPKDIESLSKILIH